MPEENTFDPKDSKYRQTQDLPEEQRENFVDVEDGFVTKEAAVDLTSDDEKSTKANSKRSLVDKMLKKNILRPTDIAHDRAHFYDQKLTKEKQSHEQRIIYLEQGLRDSNYTANHVEKTINEIHKISLLLNKPHTELIRAYGEKFLTIDAENKNFSNWSHTVCHLFEGYGSDYFSFLNNDEYRDITEQLVNESMRRALEAKDPGNIGRILGPLADYNLRNMDPDQLNTFSFPLDTSQVESVKSLFDWKHDHLARLFLESASPREFFARVVRSRLIPKIAPQKFLHLLESVRGDITEDEFIEYSQKLNGGRNSSIDELRKNTEIAESAAERCEGTFVDVDGTLITEKGVLNTGLVWEIQAEKNKGRVVTIFTGGNPEEQTQRLRQLEFPEEFLPVRSKDDYKGKLLQKLIDDSPPEFQGFRAEEYRRP